MLCQFDIEVGVFFRLFDFFHVGFIYQIVYYFPTGEKLQPLNDLLNRFGLQVKIQKNYI